jgi:hypothetical protein
MSPQQLKWGVAFAFMKENSRISLLSLKRGKVLCQFTHPASSP